MSEPRYVSPMLDGFALGQAISEHSGVECYPAMRDNSEKRYIVKKISLPASQVQVEALLLTGVYRDAESVRTYYEELAQGISREVQTLDTLAGQRGFVPYSDYQIEPMETGIGYEVILLSRYRKSLERYMRRNPMTHLSAVNLGIDMCAALAVCREAGWLYVDLKPENIYLFGEQEYRIGDLGFVSMNLLKYASLPDRYRSVYTAPEVPDAYSTLNATMDTYALGLVLYQIYNQGKLPFDGDEGRKAWLEALAKGEPVAPPLCADEEMAAIITKACAYDPAERWQTPAEMGHALISYMQRNGADDIPIEPPVQPEPEPAEAEPEPADDTEAAAEGSESAAVTEEIPADPTEETPVVEENAEESAEEVPVMEEKAEESAEEVPVVEEKAEEAPIAEAAGEPAAEAAMDAPAEAELPAEPAEAADELPPAEDDTPAEEVLTVAAPEESVPEAEDAVTADWIDLMDAFLAEEEDGTEPAPAGDEPTLRELLADTDELAAEAETAEAVSEEAADILSAAQELIEHEAPAPVVVPEPIDVPIPEPISFELPEEPESAPAEAPAEETAEAPATPAEPSEPAPKSGLWKKLLAAVVALAAVAGLAYGGWYYYQNIYLQTIDAMTYDGSARSVTVTVDTAMDQSKLIVICKDTYGNATQGTLENGVVTFSDLVPGSQYIISLEPDGFHKLQGTTSVTYSTPAETQIMHLNAVTGQDAGSAIVSFGVEGSDSEEWTLTYSAEGVEPVSVSFTGHTVTINELTIGTEYTFTLSAPEGVLMVGENTVKHTASELVQARNLALSDYADGVLTVSWLAPENVSVERWIVRCSDGAGYDQLQEVTGTTAAFEGVTEGTEYTVEVTAATQTLGIRAELHAKASAVSNFTAALNGQMIELSWTAEGAGAPWSIECSADGKVLQVLTADENSATYGPVAPGTVYTFTFQPSTEGAAGPSASVEVPAAGSFSANRLDSDTIIVEMFDVPSRSNWNYGTLLRAKEKSSFSEGGKLALLYTVTKPYSFDSTEFESRFVIRDGEGKLVSVSSRTRSWDDMWDNGYCTEQISNLPAVKGSYTLTIYINNGTLAELPFTIQ